jgi:hydrogenase nickel incorporation protein HypA/HybF
MHEFPEVQALVARACAQAPPGSRIVRLQIAVGEGSGHDPRHIEAHFAEASRGTRAEGATLEFESEKLAARCAACGRQFNSGELALACLHCGATQLDVTAGKDVRLAGVQFDFAPK